MTSLGSCFTVRFCTINSGSRCLVVSILLVGTTFVCSEHCSLSVLTLSKTGLSAVDWRCRLQQYAKGNFTFGGLCLGKAVRCNRQLSKALQCLC